MKVDAGPGLKVPPVRYPASERRRIRRTLAVAMLYGVLCLLGALGWNAASGSRALAAHTPMKSGVPPATQSLATRSESAFDDLRTQAALGNSLASLWLATDLLDRYDRDRNRDDLFEAMLWIDRDWITTDYVRSGVVSRVYEQYCGERFLRWQWICAAGE